MEAPTSRVRSRDHLHLSKVEADWNPDKLEDSALNLERRKIKREEGAKAAKALESLDVKPAEEVKGADVDLIVSTPQEVSERRHTSVE